MELQIFKLSKNGSNQNVCFSSTKFRWSLMMFTSELLWWSLKISQLSQPWLRYPFLKNLIFFFRCSHFKPSQWVFIKGWPYISQDLKAKNKLLGLSSLKKPLKSLKTKFVTKHNYKTSIVTKLATIKRTYKLLYFDQRSMFWWMRINLWLNFSFKPYKYPLKIKVE